MVAASGRQHVRHQFRRDRRPTLILLILARIGEVRDDSSDASSRGGFTSIDHNQQLHKPIVNVVWFC